MTTVAAKESLKRKYKSKWDNGWRWTVKKIVLFVPGWVSCFIVVGYLNALASIQETNE